MIKTCKDAMNRKLKKNEGYVINNALNFFSFIMAVKTDNDLQL